MTNSDSAIWQNKWQNGNLPDRSAMARTYERTNATNERLQDQSKSSRVPDAPTPVDNGNSGRNEVTVEVHLDGPVFWRIAVIAEKHGMTVAEVLTDLGKQLIAPPKARAPRTRRGFTDHDRTRLRTLYAEGKSDEEIGNALGFSGTTIWKQRTRLGLQRRVGRRSNLELERMTPLAEESR